MATPKKHLTEAQILRAIVDPADLRDAQQAHLKDCPVCMAQKDRLDHTLSLVGDMARASAPEVVNRRVLLDKEAVFPKTALSGFRPFARVAVPALLVLMVVVSALFLLPGQDTHIALVAPQSVDPEAILADIEGLIENPFPQGLKTLATFSEFDTEEDFMQYIVPTIENDPRSNIPGEKGERLC